MTALIKIIGRYKPSKTPSERYLKNKVRNLGYIYSNFHLRNPRSNMNVYSISGPADVKPWHDDPSPDPGVRSPKFHALWATKTPTEILMPNGTIYKCRCYDIVIYNNRLCKHRIPEHIARDRWFARFWDIKKGDK